MAQHAVRFYTDSYRRSHGKNPRGFGMWAFGFGIGHGGAEFTPHAMSLTDAKKWATDRARQIATAEGRPVAASVAVDVLP